MCAWWAFVFFSSRRRHTRCLSDWSSDVCSSDLSSRHPVVETVPEAGCSIRGVRIGFPQNFFFDRLDADVESSVRGALARAESLGAVVVPVRVPDMEDGGAVGG